MQRKITGNISKYAPLPGEFVYKDIYWVLWSSLDIIKRIEDDFIFYPDDVLIATYPKSGTTLIEEITWLILNNADIAKAKDSPVFIRIPFIDENYTHAFPNSESEQLPIDVIDSWPRPRIMKTHLPFRYLKHHFENNCSTKILISLRNPKDTAVSMYHFYCGAVDYGPFTDGWHAFFERWKDGWISGGDWLEVTKEWWLERHRENVKIVFYEDLVTKKYESVKQICEFLGVKLSESQIEYVVEHTSFENMKVNPSTNYENVLGFESNFTFMRKGMVGDWKNWFTDDQSRDLDLMYSDILRNIDLEFKYE